MGFFKKQTTQITTAPTSRTADLAARVLNSIAEGVVLIDARGSIQFANPAAATLVGYSTPNNIIGLDIHYILKLENAEGAPIPPNENPFFNAIAANQSLSTHDFLLVSASGEQRIAVALTCTPTGGKNDYRIITFRDVTSELAKEHEREDFISTASHEMRTPVASIEGYLGLAMNPQTATIDARAKQYLEEAHKASKHLGNLFRDLLDVTKLDDHRLRPHFVPVDAIETIKQIADSCAQMIPPKKLKYSFGTNAPAVVADKKHIEPKVYMSVDLDFLRAVMENLIGNAIKYTPDGGEIWVNARGDGDKVLINVTDTGIGISADDLPHLFQKFYRVDNSQTRQIGGTGLGLYLVKERVDAMGGRVWAESAFGDGSTFFVSLPRISDADYQKLSIAHANEQMVQNFTNTLNGTAMPQFNAATNATMKSPITSNPNNTIENNTPQLSTNTSVNNINNSSASKVAASNTAQATNPTLVTPGARAVQGASIAPMANPASNNSIKIPVHPRLRESPTPTASTNTDGGGELSLALEAAQKALAESSSKSTPELPPVPPTNNQ